VLRIIQVDCYLKINPRRLRVVVMSVFQVVLSTRFLTETGPGHRDHQGNRVAYGESEDGTTNEARANIITHSARRPTQQRTSRRFDAMLRSRLVITSVVVLISLLGVEGQPCIPSGVAPAHWRTEHWNNHKDMGVDVYLYLFNRRVFNERIVPAYKAFANKDDLKPLIALLREAIQRIDKGEPFYKDAALSGKAELQEALDILDGTTYYNRNGDYRPDDHSRKTTREDMRVYVEGQCSLFLILFYCVPADKGVIPEVQLTRSEFGIYLTDRLEWFNDFVLFSHPPHGGEIDQRLWEASEFLSKKDIQEFQRQLAKVPSPPKDSNLRKEYENLSAILKLALADADLTLVMSQA